MRIHFVIEYHTRWGEQLYISGPDNALESWDTANAIEMEYSGNGQWSAELDIKKKKLKIFSYKYFLLSNGTIKWEWGRNRELHSIPKEKHRAIIRDYWRTSNTNDEVFHSAAFSNNLFRRKKASKKTLTDEKATVELSIDAPAIQRNAHLCVLGSTKSLGNWSEEKAIKLDDREFPVWKTRIRFSKKEEHIEYKYCIADRESGRIIEWEAGPNRLFKIDGKLEKDTWYVQNDQNFRHHINPWKGAGIAIPVFSLRSNKSFGVGEFSDMKPLIDWALECGIKLIQILPINDTVAKHTWKDSYPYAAISVFALHPIYLHPPSMGVLKDGDLMNAYYEESARLNKLATLDYDGVMKLKSRYYKNLYDQDKKEFLKDPEFHAFFEENKEWLIPYAAFSRLRDLYKTPDFSKWKDYAVYDAKKIRALVDPDKADYDDYAVHYFIQFHLDRQLKTVAAYARKKGVVLKGDIPIGIYRHSVDAWIAPNLYNMDKQAGAPPDDFSATGQNWGFPTYNWEEMAMDGYRWWRERLSKMSTYFDAYRIDHILGFFRIWEIPYEHVEGLMGRFNPALPILHHEIEERDTGLEVQQLCEPEIKNYMLDELFGEYKDEVVEKFLVRDSEDRYRLRKKFDSQRQVKESLKCLSKDSEQIRKKKKLIQNGLFTLIGNLIFFKDDAYTDYRYHPRIAFQHTFRYHELDERAQYALNSIYNHYFYERQEAFWREQAMVKLPAITSATNMLVCGEDLGMVPACVPGVMNDLGILSLEIQRMPKDATMSFSDPRYAPYLSVCSTSSHDMSTLRGWWEEDREIVQEFFNRQLQMSGEAPQHCDPWIIEMILDQHLHSPAMWAIFPLQDLLAMDDKLKLEDPGAERINVPGNANHYWQYRMHISIEDLLKEKAFNHQLKEMIEGSGRYHAY